MGVKLWALCALVVLAAAQEDWPEFEDEAPVPPVIEGVPEVPKEPAGPPQYAVYLETALQLPLKLETAYFQLYQKLRANTVAYLLTFYTVVLYLVCALCRRKNGKQVPLAYKVIDERPQSEVYNAIAAELQRLKLPPHEPRLSSLQNDLQSLLSSHYEFQSEILASHQDIAKQLTGEAPEPPPACPKPEPKGKPAIPPAAAKKQGRIPMPFQPRENVRPPLRL